jgi:hypothetical protein
MLCARDSAILNLPPSVRKRLDDRGVTVMRDDVFCGFVREQFLQRSNLPVKPSAIPIITKQ